MRKKYILAGFVLLILLLPSVSASYDGELVIAGSWSIVDEGFQSISLFLSDVGWKGLAFTVIAMGIFTGLFGAVAAGLMTGKATWSKSALQFGTGIVIFLTFFSPLTTAKLTVYDRTLNKFGQYQLPQGIVLLASIPNIVERGVLEALDTSRPPGSPSFLNENQWLGLEAGKNLLDLGGIQLVNDSNMYHNLVEYVKQCVFFEILRPGTTLSENELNYTTTDWIASFAQAANPAIWMVWDLSKSGPGETVTCEEGWNRLQPYLNNSANYTNAKKKLAQLGGIDTNDVVQFQSFLTATDANLNYHFTKNIDGIMPFMVAAKSLREAAQQGGDALYYRSLNEKAVGGYGSLLAFDRYMPLVRGVMIVVSVSLAAILSIFIPTPLFKKVLMTVMGLTVFNSIWGIADGIVARMVTANLYPVIAELREIGWGLVPLLDNAPSAVADKLFVFGMVRGMGMILATAIAGTFGLLGTYAMTSIASSMMGQIQHAGATAGQEAYSTEGRKQKLDSTNTMPSTAWASTRSWGSMMMEERVNQAQRVGRAQGGGQYSFQDLAGSLQGSTQHGIEQGFGQGDFMRQYGAGAVRDKTRLDASLGYASSQILNQIAGGTPEGMKQLYKMQTAGLAAKMQTLSYDQALQMEKQQVAHTRGMQARDIMVADQLGFVKPGMSDQELNDGYTRFQAWKIDRIANDEIAGNLKSKGVSWIEKGMQLNFGFDPSTNQLTNITGMLDDSGRRVVATGAGSVEETRADGISTTMTKDYRGNVVTTEQRGVLSLDTATGKALAGEIQGRFKEAKVFEGQQVSILRGSDGQISTVYLQRGADSKEFDTYSYARKSSHDTRDSIKKGREEVDNTYIDKRDVRKAGSETISGHAEYGAPGIVVRDAAAMLNAVRNKDMALSKEINTGDLAHDYKQLDQQARDFAKTYEPIITQRGQKIERVSFEMRGGLNTPIFSASVGGGKTNEVQQTNSVLYASYMETMRRAKDTAASRGLTVEQAQAEGRARLAHELDTIAGKKPTLGQKPEARKDLPRDAKGRPIFEDS
ncbi:MAG: conjugal transfer protein TraG N-terminal domain-containing protein [Nitrospirota bacterium]